MTTREQEFAVDAYQRVREFARQNTNSAARSQYKSIPQELPIMIHRAGLLQALAFIDRSSADADRLLVDDVAHTVTGTTRAQLFTKCMGASLPDYMQLTQRVAAALVWYKRATQVLLDDNPHDAPAQVAAAVPATEGA